MKKRVLVIDDDQNILELIQAVLETEGHEAILLSSGEAAVQQVQATHPDVILLDIVMGPSHGMEVLAELRQAAPSVPVVRHPGAVSQVDDMPTIARALGARDFIEKPFDAERLLDVVRQA